MTRETREERFRRLLDEMTADAPFGGDDSPEGDRLYSIVFQALEEDAYPPLPDLAAAVEARLAQEGTLRSSPSGAESVFAFRPKSARLVRASALELAPAAALVAAGIVLLPGLTLPLELLFDVFHRHWSGANLDLLSVSGLAGLLLLLLDRAVPGPSALAGPRDEPDSGVSPRRGWLLRQDGSLK